MGAGYDKRDTSIAPFGSAAIIAANTTRYGPLGQESVAAIAQWNTPSAENIIVDAMYVHLDVAPGGATTFTVTLLINTVPTVCQVVITGAATTGNIEMPAGIEIARGDEINIEYICGLGASGARCSGSVRYRRNS